jgi:thiol-disulfide isomerase/thioredoxin
MWLTNLQRFWIGVLLLGLSASASLSALEPGDPLPDLSTFGLEGEIPELTGKVVLLDFWASWCAPCKASFPVFDELHRDSASKGLVIFAVSTDQKVKAYESFLKRMQPTFTTVWDGKQTLVAELSPPAMPTSYLFGRDGKLRSVHRGFHGDKTALELKTEIEALLQEKL